MQSYSFGNWGPQTQFHNPRKCLLWEIRGGLFLLFLLPRDSKFNSQFWTGLGVWQQIIYWNEIQTKTHDCYFNCNKINCSDIFHFKCYVSAFWAIWLYQPICISLHFYHPCRYGFSLYISLPLYPAIEWKVIYWNLVFIVPIFPVMENLTNHDCVKFVQCFFSSVLKLLMKLKITGSLVWLILFVKYT